jgi:chaperonin GroES
MKFRPLHDRVVVRSRSAEDGSVTPLDVKAGDRILFGKWSGTEVKIDGEDLLIMKESDILGIVG